MGNKKYLFDEYLVEKNAAGTLPTLPKPQTNNNGAGGSITPAVTPAVTPTTPPAVTPIVSSGEKEPTKYPFAIYEQFFTPITDVSSLYSYDVSSLYSGAKSSASSAYDRLKAEAEKTALQKKAYADTRSALMYKYLPDTMNAMGLSNTGLASQAAISLDNNYNQYVMGAMSEAENRKDEGLWQYQQALNEINSQEAAAKAQQQSQIASAKMQQQQAQQQNFLKILEMANTGNFDNNYLQYVGAVNGLTEEQMQGVLDLNAEVSAKNHSNKYASAFASASTYAGTREGLQEELKAAGFNETEINAILSQYDAGKAKQEETKTEATLSEYNKYFAEAENYNGSRKSFENYVKSAGFTAEQVAAIMKNYDENGVNARNEKNAYSYDNLVAMWDEGNFDTKAVDDAYEKGYITPAERGKFIRVYNDAVDTENYFEMATNPTNAKKMLDNAMNDNWLGTDTKTAIQNSYNKFVANKAKELGDDDTYILSGYGVNTADTTTTIDPSIATRSNVYNIIDVQKNNNQAEYTDRILEVSKNWGNDMNGTFVNFNYGLNAVNSKGDIFVFWNGKWYKTNYKSDDDVRKNTGITPYAEYGSGGYTPKSFYDTFGEPPKKYGGNKGGSLGVVQEVK